MRPSQAIATLECWQSVQDGHAGSQRKSNCRSISKAYSVGQSKKEAESAKKGGVETIIDIAGEATSRVLCEVLENRSARRDIFWKPHSDCVQFWRPHLRFFSLHLEKLCSSRSHLWRIMHHDKTCWVLSNSSLYLPRKDWPDLLS